MVRHAWAQAFASCAAVLAAACPTTLRAAGAEAEALWALLAQQGQVVLMRHTITTPGVGDPQHIGNPRGSGKVREMRAVATEAHRGNVVVVSHGTTITAVSGVNLEPGDMLVVTPRGEGNFEVRGRLRIAAP